MIGVVQTIKYEGEDFNSEAKRQNKMLEELNEDFDETTENMIRVDNKMKELIKKASQCKLWTVLIIEFVILLVLIILGF